MFRSRSTLPPAAELGVSSLRALRVSDPSRYGFFPCALELSTLGRASLTPFPAALANHPQPVRSTTALSPVSGTFARHVTPNPFVCRSCAKHRGWGVPGRLRQVARGVPSPLCPGCLGRQTGQAPGSAISLTINTCRTATKQTVLTPFRMNVYEKPRGPLTGRKSHQGISTRNKHQKRAINFVVRWWRPSSFARERFGGYALGLK